MTGAAAPLVFHSPGRSNDASMLAAADIAAIAQTLDVSYRMVGGNAVSLLAELYGVAHLVPSRDTADVDFGADPKVVADPALLQALLGLGYHQVQGNRFARTTTVASPTPGQAEDRFDLVVDVLAPSWTGRLETNQPYGDLVVDEVPGLALALSRPGVSAHVEAHLTTGQVVTVDLVLPDLVSALCLKSYAYVGRLTSRDAQDLWRLLEAAFAAGMRADGWPAGRQAKTTQQILRQHFGGPGARGAAAATPIPAERTRIQALVARVAGVTA